MRIPAITKAKKKVPIVTRSRIEISMPVRRNMPPPFDLIDEKKHRNSHDPENLTYGSFASTSIHPPLFHHGPFHHSPARQWELQPC